MQSNADQSHHTKDRFIIWSWDLHSLFEDIECPRRHHRFRTDAPEAAKASAAIRPSMDGSPAAKL